VPGRTGADQGVRYRPAETCAQTFRTTARSRSGSATSGMRGVGTSRRKLPSLARSPSWGGVDGRVCFRSRSPSWGWSCPSSDSRSG